MFNVERSMFDVQSVLFSMFIFSKSMARAIFAFKYEDKKIGGVQRFEGVIMVKHMFPLTLV